MIHHSFYVSAQADETDRANPVFCLFSQQTTDALFIRAVDHIGLAQVSFAFGVLLGQDMAVVGLATFDFATSCNFKTLLAATVSFHFRHKTSPLINPGLRGQKPLTDLWNLLFFFILLSFALYFFK
jgi:hypothetical protein